VHGNEKHMVHKVNAGCTKYTWGA